MREYVRVHGLSGEAYSSWNAFVMQPISSVWETGRGCEEDLKAIGANEKQTKRVWNTIIGADWVVWKWLLEIIHQGYYDWCKCFRYLLKNKLRPYTIFLRIVDFDADSAVPGKHSHCDESHC